MVRALSLTVTPLVVAFTVMLRSIPFGSQALKVAEIGLAAILAGVVGLLVKQRRASPIHLGLAGFVLLGAAGLWLWPAGLGRSIATYPMTWLYGILLAVAVLPLAAGREPFTAFFARQRAPEAVQGTRVFRDITHTMAWFWAGLFALAALLTLVPALAPGRIRPGWLSHVFTDLLPLGLMIGVGVPFNRNYPRYRQRLLGLEPAADRLHPRPVSAGPAGRPNSSPRSFSQPKPKEHTVENRPKIIAINGSPHQAIGNASQMVAMLKPHLADASFDLEEVFLAGAEIKYCVGCGICLEKGGCWIQDDHRVIMTRVLEADAVILAAPVYFLHVTAQMKTFIDRSLAYGHKPRPAWKPGLAVAVSAGMGETAVAQYLESVMRAYGAFAVGSLTAIAVGPGEFVGKEAVEARAADLAGDLVRAVREKRRYPATDRDLAFWHFMGTLVKENRAFMKHDYEHWNRNGLFDSFEAYAQQKKSPASRNLEGRKAWLEQMIARQKEARSGAEKAPRSQKDERTDAANCRELLETMPLGFRPEAAEGFGAVYQFEVADEGFVAHLAIASGECSFHDGPAAKPDVVIRTPGKVWLAIARGELDGQQAFLSGQYTVEGDIGRLMKLRALFG